MNHQSPVARSHIWVRIEGATIQTPGTNLRSIFVRCEKCDVEAPTSEGEDPDQTVMNILGIDIDCNREFVRITMES